MDAPEKTSFAALVEAFEAPPMGTGEITLAELDVLMEEMFGQAQVEPVFLVHPKRMHWLRRAHANGQRYAQWKKIRQRQRRAAQRRHERGER